MLPWTALVVLLGTYNALDAVGSLPKARLRSDFRGVAAVSRSIASAERDAFESARGALAAQWTPRPKTGPGDLLANRLAIIVLAMGVLLVFSGPLHLRTIGAGNRVQERRVSGRRVLRRVSPPPERWRVGAARRGRWAIGKSATGRGRVEVGCDARVQHTWVVGGSGTGKTRGVLLPAIQADIGAGRAVVFIDGKGDQPTLAAVAGMARAAGRARDYRFFDLRRPGESCTYSPLTRGTANEVCDRIMQALRWSNEYYEGQSQKMLLRLLRALEATGFSYSLDDVVAACSDPITLDYVAKMVSSERGEAVGEIYRNWKQYRVETSGMLSQLEALLLTDFGDLLKSPRPALDLARAYEERSIVHIVLPVAQFPQTAPLLAKLILGDLNSVAGLVQAGALRESFMSVVIDEFAAFAMPSFIDLLNKARSAGIGITISHQSMMGDLENCRPGYAKQVADNTNIKICLRQQSDAESFANMCGTMQVAKRTDRTQKSFGMDERTGDGTERDADEYRVHPNIIRELPRGMAIVKVDHPWLVDVVRLDHFDTSKLPPFDPGTQRGGTGTDGGGPGSNGTGAGLQLRMRVREALQPVPRRRGKPSPGHFEGA
jgi:hypothetical protein